MMLAFGIVIFVFFLIFAIAFMYGSYKDRDEEIEKEREVFKGEEYAISTMLDYYIPQEVVQWCISTYKWTSVQAKKRVEEINLLKTKNLCTEKEEQEISHTEQAETATKRVLM